MFEHLGVMVTPKDEPSSAGWKLAGILGAIICGLMGVIATGAVFHYGLVRDVGTLHTGLESSQTDRARLHDDVNKVDVTLELMRKQIGKLTRSIDRLADAQCYRDTGRPCPSDVTDESH